ncbi:MAG: hypothetical protein LBT06_07465 [Hungatella sp.]|nr:hypothetical protein [Hungatella sp.]
MALTNEDLQSMAALINQTLDEKLKPITRQGEETFKELMIVEKHVIANHDSLKELHTKYDTLLLKADNTDLLLKLINRQSEEMDMLKTRVDQLERRMA